MNECSDLLDRNFENFRGTINRMYDLYVTLKNERNALRVENRNLNVMILGLNNDIAVLRERCDRLQNDRDAAVRERDGVIGEIARLSASKEGLEYRVGELVNQIDALNGRLDALREEAAFRVR